MLYQRGSKYRRTNSGKRKMAQRRQRPSRSPRQSSPMYVTEGAFQRAPVSYGTSKIMRTWDVGNIIIPAAASSLAGPVAFQLDYLSGYAEITSLYSQYRVDRIVLQFMPSGYQNCALYTAIDYNDAIAPTSAQILEKDSCHVTPPGQPFTMSYKPRIGYDVQDNLGNVPGTGFISSNVPTVTHVGPKYFCTTINGGSVTAATYCYRLVAKVYLSVRNAK